ncbi:hypothetical protein [Paenibacillus brevis]|uniref:hypothetical protein n=1 Tax=Paenibacillus brevis TaxID=2841508 RepID=UPI001C117F44|nr:hypothetical protein [Paenibacillus brevis]
MAMASGKWPQAASPQEHAATGAPAAAQSPSAAMRHGGDAGSRSPSAPAPSSSSRASISGCRLKCCGSSSRSRIAVLHARSSTCAPSFPSPPPGSTTLSPSGSSSTRASPASPPRSCLRFISGPPPDSRRSGA